MLIPGTFANGSIFQFWTLMGSSVAWWELGISTGLPFSTPKGLAFGPHPTALQYVDNLYLIRLSYTSVQSPGYRSEN